MPYTETGFTMTATVKSKEEWVVPLPSADDESTPAQRRLIDAHLAEARKGPYYGPFETADEAIKFLSGEIRSRKAAKRGTN
jgi:hypothetical protein